LTKRVACLESLCCIFGASQETLGACLFFVQINSQRVDKHILNGTPGNLEMVKAGMIQSLWTTLIMAILCGTALRGFMPLSKVYAENLVLVNVYADDFSHDKARYDSYARSLIWVDKAFPPDCPHLVYTEDQGDSVLLFRGHSHESARLGYCFPVNPDVVLRSMSWILEVELDVRLGVGKDPDNPDMGYLQYQYSRDGKQWSASARLDHGRNQLSLGLLSDNPFLRFSGDNAMIVSLKASIYRPQATILVPQQVANIQSAIDIAQSGDRIVLADGRYTGALNTNLSFLGKDITLMSANGPSQCIIDCQETGGGFSFTRGESNQAVLYGLTIVNGRSVDGGGIYCEGGSPTVSNCIVQACRASGSGEPGRGGGVCVMSGYPVVRNCLILDNQAGDEERHGQGGGVYVGATATARITGGKISGNDVLSPDDLGGGIYVEASADGGLDNLTIENCVISGNRAGGYGGGVFLRRGAVKIQNCTIVQNSALGGGGVFPHFTSDEATTAVLGNSILWANSPDQISSEGVLAIQRLSVSYCTMPDTWVGAENITHADPCFADAEHEDYHLQSTAGRWSPDEGRWLHDVQMSPCVDAGDPTRPYGCEHSLDNGRVNLGAYGGTRQASVGFGRQVFHVDLQGNDQNSGRNRGEALYSIQRAVDLSQDGDFVLVWPGFYTEDVAFGGKAITVQSAADAATVSGPTGYAFSFYQGEGPSSVLRNFILYGSLRGAVFCQAASPSLSNLTIVNNPIGIDAIENTGISVRNCIFWNNSDVDLVECTAHYSCIKSEEGVGNIDRNPLFADPLNGDFHLCSKYGRYWPEHDVWIVDQQTSPCIDRGEPGTYPWNEPLYNGSIINMGAHGGTGYSSMSPPQHFADFNHDGFVDFADFALFADYWLNP